jgi:hypothetical protein
MCDATVPVIASSTQRAERRMRGNRVLPVDWVSSRYLVATMRRRER